MKNWKFLSQRGSMMVEALAMLGLITMVTPVLYKKAAERTTELQDINTATQMRTLSKALDDFIGDNYNDLADGPEGETEIDKAEIEPYLPYNFNLDASRLFDDFQFAIRNEKINPGTEKEHSAITGVVLAKAADEIPMLRASKIASMVGANGGVVRSQEIQGVQGGWDAPLSDFFATGDVPDGSLATSSVHAVTASGGGGGADSKHVLYRDTSKGDVMYNTMETTLYMGGENLEDVSKIVAAAEAGRDGTEAGAVTIDGKLISTGDLDVGSNASVSGALSANTATITGDLTAGATTVESLISNGVANITGLLTAGAGIDVTDGGIAVKGGDVSVEAGKLIAKGGAVISGSSGENDTANSEYALVSDGNLLVKNNAHVIGSMRIDTDLVANNLFGESSIGGGALGDGNYNFVADASQVTVAGNNLMVGDSVDPRLYTTDTSVQAGVGSAQLLIDGTTAGLEAAGSSVWVDNQGNAALQGTGQVDVRVADSEGAYPTYLTMDSSGALLKGNNITANAGNSKLAMSDEDVRLGLVSTSTNADGSSTTGYGSNLHLASDGAVLTGTGGGVLQPEVALTNGDVNIQGSIFSVNTDNLQVDVDDIVFDENAEIPEDSDEFVNRSSGVRINRNGIIQLPAVTATRDNVSRTDLAEGDGQQDVPGYIKLDRIIANEAYPSWLGRGNQYSLNIKGDGNTANNPYDAYQVNPAYTSVMHDIKLTTRGGARLSDILPDFINKGIYVLDNTYKEETDKASWEDYEVSVGSQVTVSGAPGECTSSDCIATPWLGFVPTPQCPPGYSKVITISPIRWKMAEAYYIPGSKPTAGDVADKFRAYFIPPTDPTTAHFQLAEADGSAGSHTHPLAEGSGYPLTFQTNTWLNTTVSGVKGNGGTATGSGDQGPSRYDTFVGWHAIMGFLYYAQDYSEYLKALGQGSLATQNVVVWNLFPVYNEEMTAIANVYCYFERRDINETPSWSWNPAYVDTGYDQLTKFRFGFTKYNSPNDAYHKRLNDPALDYDEVW